MSIFAKAGVIVLKRQSFFTALLAVSIGAIFLFKSADLGEGIRRGLFLCSHSVIPSLFPFMALSVFICKSSAADFFGLVFSPVTRLLKIPKVCGGVLLSALIGGYPSAAKCINDLVTEGKIDRKTASKMLCYCVNAGPPFLISAVGAMGFGSFNIGLLLFAAQFLSSAIIGAMLSAFSKRTVWKEFAPAKRKSSALCIIESVTASAESCFRMCAFIILGCGVTELVFGGGIFSVLTKSPLAKALFTGFFEVTAGTLASAEAEGFYSVIAAGAIASFSGISVMLQVAAIMDKSGIDLVPFLLSRFVHAGLTAGILRLFFLFFGGAVSAFSVQGGKTELLLSASAPAAVSLLCMASLFLLSFVPAKSEKEPFFSRIKYKFTYFKHSQTKKYVLK